MEAEDGTSKTVSVAKYIDATLRQDELEFTIPLHRHILDIALEDESERSTEQLLLNYPEPEVAALAFDLATDTEQLSRLHQQKSTMRRTPEQEAQERANELFALARHIITDYKLELVRRRVKQVMRDMQDPTLMEDQKRYMQVMTLYKELKDIEKRLSKVQGGRVLL